MSYNIFLKFLWIYYHLSKNTRNLSVTGDKYPRSTNFCLKICEYLFLGIVFLCFSTMFQDLCINEKDDLFGDIRDVVA